MKFTPLDVVAKNKAILLQIPIEFVQNYLPDVEQYVFAVNDKMDNDENVNKLKNYLLSMQKVNDERNEEFRLNF